MSRSIAQQVDGVGLGRKARRTINPPCLLVDRRAHGKPELEEGGLQGANKEGRTMKLRKNFRARLQKRPNKGGWTYVVWPQSVKFFGTRGLVRIKGKIDGHPFRSSFMAMGDGVHMLPVRADVREAIDKEAGDMVSVRLEERIVQRP
jgi:Domain of unknown function (DUF1905)